MSKVKGTRIQIFTIMCELIKNKVDYAHKLKNSLEQYHHEISLSEIVREVLVDMRSYCYEYNEVLEDLSVVDAISLYLTLSEEDGGVR